MLKFVTKPVIVVALLASGTLVWAFSGGPPDGVTGAPSDALCTGCHTSFPANSGDGTLTVTAPAEYAPNDTVLIEVDLAKPGQMRWGFEATVLDAANNPVGSLLVIDPTHTQSSVAGTGRQYVKHTSTGTYLGTADASPGWSFAWVAPPSAAGPVTVWCAGNAANGNLNNQGDFIYTTSRTIDPAPPPLCCVGQTGNVNGDALDNVTLTDLTVLVNHLFVTFQPLPCPAEANINGDAACLLSLTDLTVLVNYLFVTFQPTASCGDFDETLCN